MDDTIKPMVSYLAANLPESELISLPCYCSYVSYLGGVSRITFYVASTVTICYY